VERVEIVTAEKTASEQIVRSYIDAYNNNDPDLAMTYLADDFERYSNTTRDWQPMPKKEFYEMWVCFQKAFPGFKWELLDLICDGDTVAIEVKETGTFSNVWEMPGISIKPNGKSYSSNNSLFFHVSGGLIKDYRQYAGRGFDALGINMLEIDSTY